ncbi:MAG: hypothetical protein QW279_16445 [Candidatus Jordarchaeaceae archaeon]
MEVCKDSSMGWYGRDLVGYERLERPEKIPENISLVIEHLNELDKVKTEELYAGRRTTGG